MMSTTGNESGQSNQTLLHIMAPPNQPLDNQNFSLSSTDLIKNSCEIQDQIRCLAMQWKEIGYSIPECKKKASKTQVQICEAVNNYLESQRNLLEEFKSTREAYCKELRKLTNGLRMPPFVMPAQKTSLIEQIEWLEEYVNKLNIVKNERMARLDEIMDRLSRTCRMLGMDCPKPVFATEIPDPQELDDLNRQCEEYEGTLSIRRDHFKAVKESIMDLCQCIGYEPDKSYLYETDIDSITLSESNMKDLKLYHAKIGKIFSDWESKRKQSLAYLQKLFDRLNVDPEIRNELMESLTTGTLLEQDTKIMEAIEKYELMKKQSMKTLIDNMLEKIETLSRRCMVVNPPIDRAELMANDASTMVDDEIMDKLETELSLLEKYACLYGPVLEKMNEWRNCMIQLNELDLITNDPACYNNRGGILLKRERERKLLKKKLPKMSKDIELMIKMIEAKENLPFNIYGLDVQQFFDDVRQKMGNSKKTSECSSGSSGYSGNIASNNSEPITAAEIYFQAKLNNGNDLHSTALDLEAPGMETVTPGQRAALMAAMRRRSRSFNDLPMLLASTKKTFSGKSNRNVRSPAKRPPFRP